jgi:ligand-binding sensor domain-containing protein
MMRDVCAAPIGILGLSLILAGLCGCSDSGNDTQTATETPSSAPLPAAPAPVERKARVIESFDVGPQVYVRSLATEPEKNALWVGTSVGVNEVDLTNQQVLHTFTRDDGLANEYVFAMMVDHAGNKWFGTNGGGMTRYNQDKWQTYFPMHGLADYWVYAFAEQSDGTLWIGTWNGANHFDPANNKFVTYHDELVNEWVYGVAIDSSNRIWFGTEGGVSMYNGKQWQAWTHKEGLGAPNKNNLPPSQNTGLGTRARHDLSVLNEGGPTYNPSYVFCIYIANDDTVWAGTWGGGVSHFDGKEWHNLTTEDGLAGNIVFSMTQDKYGAFWFGTEKGLSRYDGKSWQTIGYREGLLGDSVYAVVATPAGEIWAGSLGGVTHIAYR